MSSKAAPRDGVVPAVRSGGLPDRDPDRVYGGLSAGASCAICGQGVSPGELELELDFAAAESGGSPDCYHVHLRCYSAWKVRHGTLVSAAPERERRTELSSTCAEITLRADERDPPVSEGAA